MPTLHSGKITGYAYTNIHIPFKYRARKAFPFLPYWFRTSFFSVPKVFVVYRLVSHNALAVSFQTISRTPDIPV